MKCLFNSPYFYKAGVPGADAVSIPIMWKFRFSPILLIIFPIILCKLGKSTMCEITTFTWSVSAPEFTVFFFFYVIEKGIEFLGEGYPLDVLSVWRYQLNSEPRSRWLLPWRSDRC